MRLIILIFISANLFSQDTIVLSNNKIESGKIVEISHDRITYQPSNSVDGVRRSISKKQVAYLKYPNGKTESFRKDLRPEAIVVVKNRYNFEGKKTEVKNTYVFQEKKIEIKERVMFYGEEKVSDEKLLQLILNYPSRETSTQMLAQYSRLKQYKKRTTFGFVVLGVGTFTSWFYFGIPAGVLGTMTAVRNINKAKSKRLEIAKLYNAGH